MAHLLFLSELTKTQNFKNYQNMQKMKINIFLESNLIFKRSISSSKRICFKNLIYVSLIYDDIIY